MLARALLLLLFLSGCYDADPSPEPAPTVYGLYDGHPYRCHSADQQSAETCEGRAVETCEDLAVCQWSYVAPGVVVNGIGTCSRGADVAACWVGGET
jgi:hypothetical protein